MLALFVCLFHEHSLLVCRLQAQYEALRNHPKPSAKNAQQEPAQNEDVLSRRPNVRPRRVHGAGGKARQADEKTLEGWNTSG